MQTQLPAPEVDARIPGLSRWPTVVGLALALVLIAAIGLAQLGGDPTRTGESVAVSNADHTLPNQGAARGTAPPPVVYIAATPEQAADALRFSAEMNALRVELGQVQVSVGVLVAGTDSALALDALPGAPGTRFFDLRTP